MTGAVRWRSDLRQQVVRDVHGKAARALTQAGEALRDEANKTVPHRDGTLTRSSRTVLDGDTTVHVTYDTPYARRQHKKPGTGTRPDVGAKWLQATWNESGRRVLAWLVQEMKL